MCVIISSILKYTRKITCLNSSNAEPLTRVHIASPTWRMLHRTGAPRPALGPDPVRRNRLQYQLSLKGTSSRVVTGKLVQRLQIGKNLWHTLRGARLIWAPTSGRPAISLLTLPLAAGRCLARSLSTLMFNLPCRLVHCPEP